MTQDTEMIRATRLPNGALVLTEAMPGVESVSLGVWTDAGSADEIREEEFGQAHFLEHMLFKGTETRSAYALAEAIEDTGGQLNAYTERDTTQVYARTLADHLPLAVELLGDMLCHSTFDEGELQRERQVIIEEILKYESLPEERIHDLFMEGLWHGGTLGHPILGTEESVEGMPRQQVADCWAQHFAADRVIIAAAGKLDHAAVVDLCAAHFAALPPARGPVPTFPLGTQVPLLLEVEAEEQVNFSWGGRTFPARDERNFPLIMIDAALGNSTTSRLFQEIREKRGLAYDIASFTAGFREDGFFTVNGAANPESFPEVLQLARQEVDKLREQGMTERELARAREQMKVGLALSLENTSDRMRRLAQHQLTWGRVYSLTEIMERLNAVTPDDVCRVMQDVLDTTRWTFAAIGQVNEKQVRRTIGAR